MTREGRKKKKHACTLKDRDSFRIQTVAIYRKREKEEEGKSVRAESRFRSTKNKVKCQGFIQRETGINYHSQPWGELSTVLINHGKFDCVTLLYGGKKKTTVKISISIA